MSEESRKGITGYIIGMIIFFLIGGGVGALVGSKLGIGQKKLKSGQTLEQKLADINTKLAELETLSKGPARGKLEEGKEYKFDLSKSPVLGNPDAKVKVVIWSDYQCPFCERMDATLEEVVRANPDKYALYVKNKVVHPSAMLEHEAALSAHSQGKFWELHSLFFKNRAEMTRLGQEGEEKLKEKIFELATQAGVNVDQLKADLESHKFRAQIDEENREAIANQIMSTPSVFINGYFYGYDPAVIKAKMLEGGPKPAEAKESAKAGDIEGVVKEIDAKLENLKTVLERRRGAGAGAAEKPRGPEQGKEHNFDLTTAPVLGNRDAKVKVVIFSDFQCPYCERMGGVLEEIHKANPKQVAIFYKNFVVHENAILEHEAAMAAHSQGKFWEYHDLLFKNRMELLKLSQAGEAQLKEKLVDLAKQIGLNTSKFQKELENHTYNSVLKSNIDEGRKANVTGTPAVFINGYFYGYQPDVIKAKIEEEAKK